MTVRSDTGRPASVSCAALRRARSLRLGKLREAVVRKASPSSARYVYLTGHLMFWMSIVIAASLVEVLTDIPQTTLVIVGAVIIACYWTLQPLWIAPLMKRLMGHDQFGLGHTTSTLALVAGYGSKALRLGDAQRHDSERLRLRRSPSSRTSTSPPRSSSPSSCSWPSPSPTRARPGNAR
ncbi:PTS transporter subunit IIC [Georgenia sp. SUBG003]|uniref:PTS transporter subunit IIC n=1 Tax=Georgenia sp. SUBG003 TaxID=1497974 RepID=UPI003AB6AC24